MQKRKITLTQKAILARDNVAEQYGHCVKKFALTKSGILSALIFRPVLSKTMVQGRNLKPAKSTAQKTSKKHRQQVERGRHKEGLKKSAKKVPSLPASIVASPSNRLCSREEQMNTCGKR